MKIQPRQVTVRQLCAGYVDSGDKGVVGLSGQLNIRPAYQREFVYKDEQRDKVIDTLRKGYPLNVMYWVRNPDADAPEDDARASYEVLDGQQRTLSICKFVNGEFSIGDKGAPLYFHTLPQDKQDQVLDYQLTVYVCEGPESEKLDWFRTINIAGEKLTEQELLNVTYTGPWLTSAKTYFSKPNCPAYGLASGYLTGSPIRQEYLETALAWISEGNPGVYMAAHKTDRTAIELWNYFTSVIQWVQATFPRYEKPMKHVPWGELYNRHKGDNLDPVELERRVALLLEDEEVTKKPGVYAYVLDGQERNLNLRAFSDQTKMEAYKRQKGLCGGATCPKKGQLFKLDEMEGDHIDPWHEGGRTIASNCRMLCKSCNRRKGGN